MITRWEEAGETARAVTSTGEQQEADQLVLCAGIEARGFWRIIGLGSVLMPMKGYSFTAPRGIASPLMSIADVARKIVFCPLDGQMRVAGLAELGESETQVDSRRIADLVSSA